MTKEDIKKLKSTFRKMVWMCDDRIGILREVDDFGDGLVRDDLDEQIFHFQSLKTEAHDRINLLDSLVLNCSHCHTKEE